MWTYLLFSIQIPWWVVFDAFDIWNTMFISEVAWATCHWCQLIPVPCSFSRGTLDHVRHSKRDEMNRTDCQTSMMNFQIEQKLNTSITDLGIIRQRRCEVWLSGEHAGWTLSIWGAWLLCSATTWSISEQRGTFISWSKLIRHSTMLPSLDI